MKEERHRTISTVCHVLAVIVLFSTAFGAFGYRIFAEAQSLDRRTLKLEDNLHAFIEAVNESNADLRNYIEASNAATTAQIQATQAQIEALPLQGGILPAYQYIQSTEDCPPHLVCFERPTAPPE